jgi:hypothetical protein
MKKTPSAGEVRRGIKEAADFNCKRLRHDAAYQVGLDLRACMRCKHRFDDHDIETGICTVEECTCEELQ